MLVCPVAPETLGTIDVLETRVTNIVDIKLSLQGNRWSEDNPNPSLDAILKTPFWSAAAYDGLRQELAKAVPTIAMMPTADFLSIDVTGGRSDMSVTEVADSEDEQEEVCSTTLLPCALH